MRLPTSIAAGLVALVALATAAPAGAESADAAKVVRNRNADVGEYPGQAALLQPGVADTFNAQFCGATLIHPQWVLTAAHCVEDELPVDVLLDTNRLDGTGTRVGTTEVHVHPEYSFPSNDIALLRLVSTVASTPARLAFRGMESLEAAGTAAAVTGWGDLTPDDATQEFPRDLQEGDVPVLADADCATALAEHEFDLPTPESLVCAGSGRAASNPAEADACQGDSGGPLWAIAPDGARRQIGIVSGGPTCGFSPTFYTSVLSFTAFVEQITGMQFASFTDIPLDAHEANIERVALNGLAGGLGGGLYGPAQNVSRGQMATFLARALRLAPQPTGPFTDVAGTPHEQNINAVAAAGVAGGFADGTFQPTQLVTRAQMATFLANALDLAPVASGPFADVAGNPHEQNINAVAADGVAGGFSDGTYRPLNGVTRAQMATFLARAFLGA